MLEDKSTPIELYHNNTLSSVSSESLILTESIKNYNYVYAVFIVDNGATAVSTERVPTSFLSSTRILSLKCGGNCNVYFNIEYVSDTNLSISYTGEGGWVVSEVYLYGSNY